MRNKAVTEEDERYETENEFDFGCVPFVGWMWQGPNTENDDCTSGEA